MGSYWPHGTVNVTFFMVPEQQYLTIWRLQYVQKFLIMFASPSQIEAITPGIFFNLSC